MPRVSLVDRVFFGAVAILLLVLGVYVVTDSAKNRGFEFVSSFRLLMLAVVTILGLRAVLRDRGSGEVDDESQAEEL
jgi:hypothetical protein